MDGPHHGHRLGSGLPGARQKAVQDCSVSDSDTNIILPVLLLLWHAKEPELTLKIARRSKPCSEHDQPVLRCVLYTQLSPLPHVTHPKQAASLLTRYFVTINIFGTHK